MRSRLIIALAAAAAVALNAAPAHAGLGSWTSLPGLNDASGPGWVREYATGLPPTTIYAATEGDGVWKSVTDGASWSDFSSGLEKYPGAKDVRTVYTSGTTVYAGTSVGLFSNSGGGWQPVAQGPESDPAHPTKLNQAVQAVLSPMVGQMLAGVASGGVFTSHDGGQTWQPPAPNNGMPPATTVWSFAQLIPGSVFAATSNGVYRSLDGGTTWTLKSDGISGTILRVVADSTRPNIFYAISPTDGVYRSITFGETWSSINGTGAKAIGDETARALQKFSGVNQTRLYVGTANGVYAGTTGNGLAPGPVTWRKVDNAGLGSNTILWALTNFTTTPGTLLAGTQSNGGYAFTFVPPANTAPPVIAGTANVGRTLVATPGTWTGSKTIEYSYQWQRCIGNGTGCGDIADATDSTYELQPEDQTRYVRVIVTGENDFPTFGKVTATSNVLGTVGAKAGTLPGDNQSWVASISGPTLPQVGDKLHAQNWLFNPAATSTKFRWLRCDANGNSCHAIPGATAQDYTLTDEDVTLRLRVEVTGTNASGSTTLDPSAPSNTIFPPTAAQVKPGAISGTGYVGETLVSSVGTWNYAGTTYTREWMRCEADGSDCETLTGETGPAYTPSADDLGHRFKVRITADSNEANHFPGPVEVFTSLSPVISVRPVSGGGGGNPQPQPQPQPQADHTPPAFTLVALAKSVKHGKAMKLRTGLTESGKVIVSLQRLVHGHRRHGKPVTFTLPAGVSILNTKKLAVGSYRAVLTPVDAAGNRGASRTLSFKVTRR